MAKLSKNIINRYLQLKSKMPMFYKVMYHGDVYAIGIKTKNCENEENYQFYDFALKRDAYTKKFSQVFFRTSIALEEDKIVPIDTLEEHIAILNALRNKGVYFNRKTMEMIPIKSIGKKKKNLG